MTITDSEKFKEREDKVEFKGATRNYSYAGSEHRDREEGRRCFLDYVVALTNEGRGCLVYSSRRQIEYLIQKLVEITFFKKMAKEVESHIVTAAYTACSKEIVCFVM